MNTPSTILVADDEEAILKSITGELSINGFKVLEARDGQEALKLALEKKPALIFLDIIMPKMSGVEVLKKLRQDEWGKSVPTVFLTNVDTDDKLLQQIMDLNPAFYLVKQSFKLSDLVEKARECLEKGRIINYQ